MNQLVELTFDPCKLKFNEKLFKHIVQIVEKIKIPPVIIIIIGSSSFYIEYSVGKFLTCLKSRPDFTIVNAKETHDLNDAKGIKLSKEIYRKNGNAAEDLAIFVFTLSRDKIKDKNHFNQLAAFGVIISSVILQTDYSILWKDTDDRVSKWIKNQEKKLNKNARFVCYPEDFSEFGEEIFTNELVGFSSPEEFGTFIKSVANLIETGLIPILNAGTPDQEPRDQLIYWKNGNLTTICQNSGIATEPKELEFDNQSRKHQIIYYNVNETQTDQNVILVPPLDGRLSFLILTKDPGFHQQLEEFLFENMYNKIEKKVEEIQYSNTTQLLSSFTQIANEIFSQFEAYQPEKGQDPTLVLGQNLVPKLEQFLKKFQNSKLFKIWENVFTALEILYTRLRQDFLENLKKMQGLNFSGWDLSKWIESLMSNVCNEYGIDFEYFKVYTYTTMGFEKVLKNFEDIIKLLSIYNEEAKYYLSNNVQKNSQNADFEDQFSEFRHLSVSKAELNEDFLNAGEHGKYFKEILDESVEIRNKIYKNIYQENEDCTKLAEFMKAKVEFKMNEFFPPKTLSTLNHIKSVVNELKDFCFEFLFEKFPQGNAAVSKIWQDFELDMEDIVRNTILRIDAYGEDLEKEIYTIGSTINKLSESNLHFDDIQKIVQNAEANFSKYQEKIKVSAQLHNSLQGQVNKSQVIAKDINICINFGYDIIHILLISDKCGKINLDKQQCGKLLKNQIALDSQGLLCFGQKADNLQNKIHGSEILNPDSQFVYEIGNVKLSKLEILALFLKHIKINLEGKNSAQIKKCILVVPTFMSMGLKSLLKMSAKIAGLNDVEILSESLAVAIYYYHAVFEKNQNASQLEYFLFNKVESSQVESWLFLMTKDELQMRELVNCAMLKDFTYDELHSNGLIKAPLADTDIPEIVKNSNYRCLKKYESMYSTRTSTWYTISFRNILYFSEEKFRNMLEKETNENLNHPSVLIDGIIWANKEFLDGSNLKNLKISTSTPFIFNISTLDEKFSRSLKLYKEFYHEPSKWISLPLRSIGNVGTENLKFKIFEVVATSASLMKNRKILNQIQLEIELFEEDEITWNFDQDGTVNFFLWVQQPIKRLIPIKYTWIFDSTLLDESNLKNSSKQVEKVFSCESNEEKMRLQELVRKSKAIINLKKDLNETLRIRLMEIFKEIDIALDNEESSKAHFKELKEKLEKYYKILSK